MKDYQKFVIEAEEPYVIVNASAAAGKTFCITERVKYLVSKGVKKSEIVVITFTTMAAQEMRDRLDKDGDGIFIGTIHAYANYLLLMSGLYTGSILKDEKYDELFKMLEDNPGCARPISHLLLDEAQDTDEMQWHIIFDILKPKAWTLVGDSRQSIYSFRGASPEQFTRLMDREDIAVYDLLLNYRNGSSILDYAKRIISKSDEDLPDSSISMTGKYGKVVEMEYNVDRIVEIIKKFSDDIEYGDWFVLTRTNNELQIIYDALTAENIPCDTFKRADLSLSEMTKRLAQNTVKVLTIHAAKGLESKAVIVVGARYWNDEERRVNYVAATRAKELLIWMKQPKKRRKPRNNMVVDWE